MNQNLHDNNKDAKSEGTLSLDGQIDMAIFNNIKDVMGNNFPILIEKYLNGSKKYIENIDKALTSNDASAVSDAAHPLKSSSAMLGIMGVSTIAEEMEHIADSIVGNGGDFSCLIPLAEQLKEKSDLVIVTLEKEL